MNVIIEGPDGAGKSTLIERLVDVNGPLVRSLVGAHLYMPLRVQAGEGPPKYPREINERTLRYLDMKHTIFDRHPCVSQPIYGEMRKLTFAGAVEEILPSSLLHFYEQDNLFIYCRAQRLMRHVVKAHEDLKHVATVEEKYALLVDMYDKWAAMRANLTYRIGDDIDAVAAFIAVHVVKRHNHGFDTTEDA